MPVVGAKIDLARFHAELQERDTVAACASLFKKAVAPFGFVSFAYGEIDLADRKRSAMFWIDWPGGWVKQYVETGFTEHDPVLNALNHFRKAFTWSDIVRDRRFSNLNPRALAVVKENDWAEGLVVPVSRGGAIFGVVSLLGRSGALPPPLRSQLCVVCECFVTRVRALCGKHEFPIPPAGLSPRQVAAVKLVATGLSDADIARALGVSRSTAHKHVEAARKRLNAKTRAHMAALAVCLGIAAAA